MNKYPNVYIKQSKVNNKWYHIFVWEDNFSVIFDSRCPTYQYAKKEKGNYYANWTGRYSTSPLELYNNWKTWTKNHPSTHLALCKLVFGEVKSK